MQRLRTTFKRSRTPTGAEMKTQSSLEVPKQVRSASFDEIQLEAKRSQHDDGLSPTSLLKVPSPAVGQRSKSFDSGGSTDDSTTYLEVPRRFQRRRSSGDKERVSPPCVHCACQEEYDRLRAALLGDDPPPPSPRSFSYSDTSSSEMEEDGDTPLPAPCSIRVTLTPNPPGEEDVCSATGRRRSIVRQEALVVVEHASLDSVSDVTSEGSDASGLVVSDIFLKVPDLKRDRAASVDSCFSKVSSPGMTNELEVPQVSLRSRSVDIVLPTEERERYKALALTTVPGKPAAVSAGDELLPSDQRALRSAPDWSEAAINGEHLWVPTSASGDLCYVGDTDCLKHGPRMKCSACKIIAHVNCIAILMERIKFTCKPTFRDVGVRQYREQTSIHHHWVHRRSQKGKCKQCTKSFQSKLSFSSKEIVALSCSWCKTAYHNKEACFNLQRIGEECSLGFHNGIIVPPSWIVKLPRKGSFKSSLRKSPKKKASSKKKSKEKGEKDIKSFVIKPIPSTVTPVLVFINPKSGGNQGAKLLQKFQWLLNPRQVFDLTQGGPKMGLEMYRKVSNLRVLACGGDGTVGWVLSVLDQINISPAPAVGVLPLGTGNDLARSLGWGGGYTDEPISKILANVGDSEIIQLDRWELKVEKNENAEINEEGKDTLPLNVVNNYFSLGVDAHIALEFHEAREAHPERFNSRLRNKMFYGQAGGKDLLRRKWKNLADLVTLECDNKDMTSKLKEHKVHAIVFLNIPSYGGGTHPWNRAGGNVDPSTDDGLIEVVGLTTYQLPLLQAGGHGTCIAQCKSARIVTTKTIPMQVDGEACKLTPSIITLSLLNKAPMLAKRKGVKSDIQKTTLEQVKVSVDRINMTDYEQHHYDKEILKEAAVSLGTIEASPALDLEHVRHLINKMLKENPETSNLLSSDWCFVDSCTAERCFRVDRAQEHLHYVMDIATDHLYVLDMETSELATLPHTPDETSPTKLSIDSQNDYGSLPIISDGSGDIDDNQSLGDSNERIDMVMKDEVIADKLELHSSSSREDEDESHIMRKEDDEMSENGNLRVSRSKENLSYLLEKTTDGVLKAAKLGDLKMLKELHSQGYSLLSIDSTGQTALHYGSRYGHKDIVKYLIACAPPTILNMADNEKGQTALHKAAAHKRRSICCMLVAGGASLTIKDHQGYTPRQLALQADDGELAAYLESQEQFQLVSQDLETVV